MLKYVPMKVTHYLREIIFSNYLGNYSTVLCLSPRGDFGDSEARSLPHMLDWPPFTGNPFIHFSP